MKSEKCRDCGDELRGPQVNAQFNLIKKRLGSRKKVGDSRERTSAQQLGLEKQSSIHVKMAEDPGRNVRGRAGVQQDCKRTAVKESETRIKGKRTPRLTSRDQEDRSRLILAVCRRVTSTIDARGVRGLADLLRCEGG